MDTRRERGRTLEERERARRRARKRRRRRAMMIRSVLSVALLVCGRRGDRFDEHRPADEQ